MFLKRQGRLFVELHRNLDLVLSLLMTKRFIIDVSTEDYFLKCLFLLALALGNRVSELQSLLRGK